MHPSLYSLLLVLVFAAILFVIDIATRNWRWEPRILVVVVITSVYVALAVDLFYTVVDE